MTTPKILSFDLDDTLWPVAPVIAAAEQELLLWMRRSYPEAVRQHDIESMRSLRAKVALQFPEQSHDFTFLRRHALCEQLCAAGYPESAADEALEVFFKARNRVEFYPDVRPALTRLRARYRLFAVSNGNADLARCGLTEFFDGHITARAAGAAKPDARIFASLISLAEVSPAEVLHIGDDPLADVVGATRAGMQAVWLNRHGREWPGEFTAAPRTVSSLDEIG